MFSTHKLLAVLAGLLLSSGSVPLTFGHSRVLTPTQEAAPQAKDNNRLLCATTSRDVESADERTGVNWVSLEELMRFEDIADKVKAKVMKYLPAFMDYAADGKEVLDVTPELTGMKLEEKMAYGLLYEVFLNNERAFRAKGGFKTAKEVRNKLQ